MTKEWHKRHFGKLLICGFNPNLYNSNSRDKTDNSKRSSTLINSYKTKSRVPSLDSCERDVSLFLRKTQKKQNQNQKKKHSERARDDDASGKENRASVYPVSDVFTATSWLNFLLGKRWWTWLTFPFVVMHVEEEERKRREKKNRSQNPDKLRTFSQRSSFQRKDNAKNRFMLDRTPAHHRFVEQVLPFVGLAYQGNDIYYV
jgi:hypothetical protein